MCLSTLFLLKNLLSGVFSVLKDHKSPRKLRFVVKCWVLQLFVLPPEVGMMLVGKDIVFIFRKSKFSISLNILLFFLFKCLDGDILDTNVSECI